MTIVEFFDPEDTEHLKAYKHLEETGVWPEWFFEKLKGLEFSSAWYSSLAFKIARKFLNDMTWTVRMWAIRKIPKNVPEMSTLTYWKEGLKPKDGEEIVEVIFKSLKDEKDGNKRIPE